MDDPPALRSSLMRAKPKKGTISTASLATLRRDLPEWASKGAASLRRTQRQTASTSALAPRSTFFSTQHVIQQNPTDPDDGGEVKGSAPVPPVLRIGADNVPLMFSTSGQRSQSKVVTSTGQRKQGVRRFPGQIDEARRRRNLSARPANERKQESPAAASGGGGGASGRRTSAASLTGSLAMTASTTLRGTGTKLSTGLLPSVSTAELLAGGAGTRVSLILQLLGEDANEHPDLQELLHLLAQSVPTATDTPAAATAAGGAGGGLDRSTPEYQKNPKFLRIDQGKLPLDMFDSTQFEDRPPQEWLDRAPQGRSPYYCGGEWSWCPVEVLGFDTESGRWQVRFTDEKRGGGREKWVTRLNLVFDAEDQVAFADRLIFAMRGREEAKRRIRLEHFIAEAAPVDAGPVQDERLGGAYHRAIQYRRRHTFHKTGQLLRHLNILDKAALAAEEEERRGDAALEELDGEDEVEQLLAQVRAERAAAAQAKKAGQPVPKAGAGGQQHRLAWQKEKVQRPPLGGLGAGSLRGPAAVERAVAAVMEESQSNPLLRALMAEVVEDYTQAVKAAVLFHELLVREDERLIGMYTSLKLPPPPVFAKPTPDMGMWPIGRRAFAFAQSRRRAGRCIRLRSHHIADALNQVLHFWTGTVGNGAVFMRADAGDLERPCHLTDFRELQKEHMSGVVKKMVIDWPRMVANHMTDSLQGGPDGFDFFTQDIGEHLASDLHRFMRQVEMLMADRLRGLVQRSCDAWVDFVEAFVPPGPAHSPEAQVFRDTTQPLFAVRMTAEVVEELEAEAAEAAAAAAAAAAEEKEAAASGKPQRRHHHHHHHHHHHRRKRKVKGVDTRERRVTLHPSVEAVHKMLIGGLAVLISKVREVRQIEQRCLSVVALPGKVQPVLNVCVDDPLVADVDEVLDDTKEAVSAALRKVVAAPLDLVDQVQRWTWLLELDPAKHVKHFFAQAALKAEQARVAAAEAERRQRHIAKARDLRRQISGGGDDDSDGEGGEEGASKTPEQVAKEEEELLALYDEMGLESDEEEADEAIGGNMGRRNSQPGNATQARAAAAEQHMAALRAPLGEQGPTPQEWIEEVRKFHNAASEVSRIGGGVELLGMLQIDWGELRDALVVRARELRLAMLKEAFERSTAEAGQIQQRFGLILQRIAQVPQDEEELVELRHYLDEVQSVIAATLKPGTDAIHERLSLAATVLHEPGLQELTLYWGLRALPGQVAERAQESMHALERAKEKMLVRLQKEREGLESDLFGLSERVDAFKSRGEGEELIAMVDSANKLDDELRGASDRADDINRREELFGLDPFKFEMVDEVRDGFVDFHKLWTSVADFNAKQTMWMTMPFLELKYSEVNEDVTAYVSAATKFGRAHSDDFPAAGAVCEDLKQRVLEFRKTVPVIENLASGALRDHHWGEITELTDKEIVVDESLTLQVLLELGIMDDMDVLEEVATRAKKEKNLEDMLDKMINEWKELELELAEYKGTSVVRLKEEMLTLLDDHIVKTQSMLGNPNIRWIKDKTKGWELRLLHLQVLLDEWMRLQRTWMYLQPIFSSDDIMRQMPAEARKFNDVDSMFRRAMAETSNDPSVLSVAAREKLLERFQAANAALDIIQKNLADYLEVKRLYFPRFFFLANDGLLEILSQTKEPRTVEKHLDKCFEGLNRITFRGDTQGNPDDLAIIQFGSARGEKVDIVEGHYVDPNAPGNRGNVEVWLDKMLVSMRLTVKDFVQKAIEDYPHRERSEWVLSHPAQAVLNISQLYWTREVEEALRRGGNKGIEEYFQQLQAQLGDIVRLVRGKLSKAERTLMGALTVIDVHAKDVVEDMVKSGVSKTTDFKWTAQLRYYWEECPDEYDRYGPDPMNLVARIINSQKLYGYEYLGNTSRLVITPLTDRCYRTLIGAVALDYGGAPAGPAGTGKTETTKDLSKAVAIFCIVYNCSDQLRVEDMAKFFKGLAASGAWSCFDEFNRIALEVLSVVAQQIQLIVNAKRQRKKVFDFWDTKLKLNPDANCFITMNPGYAGRSELPDNLKALFRPCAMMVPDYALIAEIKLYSFGFENARELARKVVQVLRLSSEQLSSQKHYDYGMRAVFSILVRAGDLRQQLGEDPDWDEAKIVLSAINDVNLPKFTTNDLPLFKGITMDLFPGVQLPQPDYRTLLNAIRASCAAQNLQPKDTFLQSTVQLRETVAVRHGLMVVGATGAGKTRVIHTLADAFCRIEGDPDYVPVEVHTINPKSITQAQLYGFTDPNTQEWADGVLAVTFKNSAKDERKVRHWIVFDGPVDAVWIEDMNTVLDDNKKLCLTSGEIVKMSDWMTMMFEAEDLKEASPATVSRVGMVFTEPHRIGWRPTVQSWMAKLPALLRTEETKAHLMDLFEWVVPPLAFVIEKRVDTLLPVTTIGLVSSTVSMLSCLFKGPFELGENSPGNPKEARKLIESLFIMSVAWSIGSVVDEKDRGMFDGFLRSLLAGKAQNDQDAMKEFLVKHPMYDGHLQGGGLALRAGQGDVRDYDPQPQKPKRTAAGAGAAAADEDGKEEDGDAAAAAEDAAAGDQDPEAAARRTGRFKLEPLREGSPRTTIASLPADRTLLDYVVTVPKAEWRPWMQGQPQFSIEPGTPFNSVLVPTIDTVRNEWVIDLLATNQRHVLCVGKTGTGKSASMADKLLNRMDKSVYLPLFINFSARTSANQTQDIIDGRLKRRRRGVYGPPLGKRIVAFVDDLNMPAKEEYGAQPPIELLRQWMDHEGWYDRADKEKKFMRLVDLQFVAAMGPPGGGRTRITQRYVRHFNILGFTTFAAEQLQQIFGTVLAWSLDAFPAAVKGANRPLVAATVDLYETIASELRPTPNKSHYTFNLRDISKVFQGIHQAQPATVADDNKLIRLWGHECMRVFQDRLVSDEDRSWFEAALAEKVRQHFRKEWASDSVRGPHPRPIFANFMNQKTRAYDEVPDHAALQTTMDGFLEDHNAATRGKGMDLVLFMNAIEHIARVCRIIQLPLGNALLVGVGGSGRKSLTTLAVSICEYELFQIEITKSYKQTEWREDLKRVLQLAGVSAKPTVFLFSDTQIKEEGFVEDINNILNNGDVPNLFEKDELAIIFDEMSKAARKIKKPLHSDEERYSFFVQRCRANLHMVLCFSPIGEAFRTRLRMFPSLVNCCTIDWFTAWPEAALRSVASRFLTDVDMEESVREGVISVCVDMQERTAQLATRFASELRRHFYVTPTSYLELINTFKGLLTERRDAILTNKHRYDEGLRKLAETGEKVGQMKEQLVELGPQLQQSSAETEVKLAEVAKSEEAASKQREMVAGEEAIANEQASQAAKLQAECQAELDKAQPIMDAAVAALDTIKKGDIAIVKGMSSPADGVKKVMGAVCVVLGVAPKKVPAPDGRGKVNDFWEPAKKKLLSNIGFIKQLKEFDNMTEALASKLEVYMNDEDFEPAKVEKIAKACAGLCAWVRGQYDYFHVAKKIKPLQDSLAAANAAAKEAQETLEVKQAALREVEEKLAALQADLKETQDKKIDLERRVDQCKHQLERAETLMEGLGGEQQRWRERRDDLATQYGNVVGDIVLSAGVVAYLGAFTMGYRQDAVGEWAAQLREKGIACAEHFSLAATLGNPVQIRDWTIQRLPNDSFSIENAIMMSVSKRWPLMIDPQGQANRWIRNLEAPRKRPKAKGGGGGAAAGGGGGGGEEPKSKLQIVKQNSSDFVRRIEMAVQFGYPVLLENVPENLDPVLEPILTRNIIKSGGALAIRIGDSTVEYDPSFKLYITTKLPNPHYPPETCVKVSLLNFMATADGLQDQMLGIVTRKLESELEQKRERVVLEEAEFNRQLADLESEILRQLAEAEGEILENEPLVRTLKESKETSDQISHQVEKGKQIKKRIDRTRKGYEPVAKRASHLFFCIADLANVDPMYQYSLEWFVGLFVLAIDKADTSGDIGSKVASINDSFTRTLYENVCRSLFEKDKLLFSLLLTIKVLGTRAEGEGTILNPAELRFFLQGALSLDTALPNPVQGEDGQEPWLTAKMWADLSEMSKFPPFDGLDRAIAADPASLRAVFDAADPVAASEELFASQERQDLGLFRVMMLLRCVRPDRVVSVVRRFISEEMSEYFVDPPAFDLAKCFADSKATAPLIFVLSPGADPMVALQALAEKHGKLKTMQQVSLGQGQGPKAEARLEEGKDTGCWVVLQNCHLAESWMPRLEQLCEEALAPETTDPSFRLWLTAMPNPKFPVSVLQNGVKITIEPARGLQRSLVNSYRSIAAQEEWYEGCQRPKEFKRLLFGLCFFHALVRERRRFGPLGWNIPYEFSEPDLQISMQQLKIFLDDPAYPDLPYETLTYLVGECNYGGRVTDDKDRRLLLNMLSDFYTADILGRDYKFSPSGKYSAPPPSDAESVLRFIRQLPAEEEPEVFGLHANADITCAVNETTTLLSTVMSLQPRSTGGGGATWEEQLQEVARDIAAKVPEPFDIEKVELDFPVKFEESMNTVLLQELMKFNTLVRTIRASLAEVQAAIKGLVVMSADLEQMGNSMVQGKVPDMWSNVAYPSLKPLGSWVSDLLQRLAFFRSWVENGKPVIYWISGMFFAQGFLTGTRQNLARKYEIPIDEIDFDFSVLRPEQEQQVKAEPVPPEDGAYVNGLYLEGCRWDAEAGNLQESDPKVLFQPMPVMHFLPKRDSDIDLEAHRYECPTYKTSERRGMLSTTGHSTNFVLMALLPMASEHDQKHWVKRGVAMLTQLDT